MREQYDCIDCGVNTLEIREYYTVHNHIWPRSPKNPRAKLGGMLCIGCLEDRIGRTLCLHDFIPFPVNMEREAPRSDRLASRLKGFDREYGAETFYIFYNRVLQERAKLAAKK